MKGIILIVVLSAVLGSTAFAQTHMAKPEVTEEAKRVGSAPEKKAAGKLEDVTVTTEDKLKVKNEKTFLELKMDINEPILSSIETEKKYLEKSPVPSVLRDALPKFISNQQVASPYLSVFRKEPVTGFSLKNMNFEISTWELIVINSKAKIFSKFEGKGTPPETIKWSGRNAENTMIKVGNPYSSIINIVDQAGNPRTIKGPSFVIDYLVFQENDGFHVSVTRSKIFNAEKEKTNIRTEGLPVLKEMSDYLKENITLSSNIEVYGEDAAIAGEQAKILAQYFTKALILSEGAIKYAGLKDIPENHRIDVIIKNRQEK